MKTIGYLVLSQFTHISTKRCHLNGLKHMPNYNDLMNAINTDSIKSLRTFDMHEFSYTTWKPESKLLKGTILYEIKEDHGLDFLDANYDTSG